ncbi:hypothetical protein [Mesorhizobium sp. B2-3-15]|uniref:hypothetical protein n=1 Tax=Mesorhizobium sp. B2-3-15 TaxID=2589949 RepID=UPI00112B184F|nr:hypothetical protein [Mesorhizobium sp. B2-3-15]TPL71477.1 hypothetical protein FJ954_17915 [Mesorhizobium sp. B2-3-15]
MFHILPVADRRETAKRDPCLPLERCLPESGEHKKQRQERTEPGVGGQLRDIVERMQDALPAILHDSVATERQRGQRQTRCRCRHGRCEARGAHCAIASTLAPNRCPSHALPTLAEATTSLSTSTFTASGHPSPIIAACSGRCQKCRNQGKADRRQTKGRQPACDRLRQSLRQSMISRRGSTQWQFGQGGDELVGGGWD